MKTDIILPIYKSNDKVFEAINSVLVQTYSNWHLYIIDDASQDNSLEIIQDKYKINSDKITYFQFNKNKRAAACRNFVVKKGNGEFIAFIDQDDAWLPDKLEQQVNYFRNNNVDVIHGNVQFIDNENNVIMQDKWKNGNQSRREVDWNNLSKEELARKLFLKPNIRIISSMVKREIFEKIGGFKEQFFGGEDEIFWFEIALAGKVGFIDQILFCRRKHESNTVDKFRNERLLGYVDAMTYLRKKYLFLKKSAYNDKFAGKLNAIAKYRIKEKRYLFGLKYIIRWLVCNPLYLFKLSLFTKLKNQISMVNKSN